MALTIRLAAPVRPGTSATYTPTKQTRKLHSQEWNLLVARPDYEEGKSRGHCSRRPEYVQTC